MKKMLTIGSLLALCSACNSDQGLKQLQWRELALVTGDFDNVGESLLRMDIGYTEYEGFISAPVYNPEVDASTAGLNPLKLENLFMGLDSDGRPVMERYDAVFINSGARGFGEFAYDSVEPDDTIISDPTAETHVRGYLADGGTLVLSDWSADIIEAFWPTTIQFAGEDSCSFAPCWDAWQSGSSEQVIATVLDTGLQESLGADSVALQFAYTYWTVIQSVEPNVEVLLSGNVEYRISSSEGYGILEDVPLLLRFEPPEGGQVIFSAFHWVDQNPAIADALLLHVAEGLTPGTVATAPEDVTETEGEQADESGD